MAHGHVDLSHDVTRLKPVNKTLGVGLMVLGLLGVVAAFAVSGGDHRRFWFAYLFGMAGITAISSASLIFVMVNHLVRAGWITNIRRILESMAVQLPLVFLLMLPLVVLVLLKPSVEVGGPHGEHASMEHSPVAEQPAETKHDAALAPAELKPADHPAEKGEPEKQALLYSWNRPAGTAIAPEIKNPSELSSSLVQYPNEQVQPGVTREYDANIDRKASVWYAPAFWALRIIVWFGAMSAMAWWFYSQSVKQDLTGDIDISAGLSQIAGPLVLAAGLILTFIAFDVYMSLDPHWFSTMFGIYFFASGTQAMWAFLGLTILVLNARGYLRESVGVEHRHDVGKFLWAFIFFWTYIAFSQYMLQWYANMPEETFWFDKRGYSTMHPNGYSPLVLTLLFGRFALPFLLFVSRHVKRSRFGLGFWSVWLLAMFFVDMYMLVIPEESYTRLFGLPELLAAGGLTILWVGSFIRTMAGQELRPISDPRVHESLALANAI